MTAVLDTDRPEAQVASPAPETPDYVNLSRPTADSANPVEPPKPSRRSFGGLRAWRNRLIVLLMVAAAAFGTDRLVQYHAQRSDQLALADVELTAQPIPVEVAKTGVITSVSVHAGDQVKTGQQLAMTAVTTTNDTGHPVTTQQPVVAPRTGYVVNDPLTVGSTLQPGMSFVQMYDPADLRLITSVPLSYLSRVSPGMTATLTAPGVPGKVTAVLRRAVPRVGTVEQSVPAGDLQLVFTATNANQVKQLLPGLRFTGTIDADPKADKATSSTAQFVSS